MEATQYTLVYPRPVRHLEEAVHVALERNGFQERRDGIGGILAVAPKSWDSWGENVAIAMEDLGEATRVTYTSQPKLGSTLFDWGKGRKNVEVIMAAVEGGLNQ